MFNASVEDVEQRHDHDDRHDGRFYWKTVIKDNDDEKEQTDVERDRNFLIFYWSSRQNVPMMQQFNCRLEYARNSTKNCRFSCRMINRKWRRIVNWPICPLIRNLTSKTPTTNNCMIFMNLKFRWSTIQFVESKILFGGIVLILLSNENVQDVSVELNEENKINFEIKIRTIFNTTYVVLHLICHESSPTEA